MDGTSDHVPAPNLHGKVAVVAGATRGAWRGIGVALGEAGATVVSTGRSSHTRALRSDYAGRPETIEETAELVDAAGGKGVAEIVDHLDPAQVTSLAERRIGGSICRSWGKTRGMSGVSAPRGTHSRHGTGRRG